MESEKDNVKKRLERKGGSMRRANWISDAPVVETTSSGNFSGYVGNKRVVRPLLKSDFMLSYLKDIREVFGLRDVQIKILLALITSYEYKDEFIWSIDSVSHISKLSGLCKSTVVTEFSRLVSRKGLIVRIKNRLYKLNQKALYHSSQIGRSESLEITLEYRFTDAKPTIQSAIERGVDIPLDFVEAFYEKLEDMTKEGQMIREIYNEQQREKVRRELSDKNKRAENKAMEEALRKNKWQ